MSFWSVPCDTFWKSLCCYVRQTLDIIIELCSTCKRFGIVRWYRPGLVKHLVPENVILVRSLWHFLKVMYVVISQNIRQIYQPAMFNIQMVENTRRYILLKMSFLTGDIFVWHSPIILPHSDKIKYGTNNREITEICYFVFVDWFYFVNSQQYLF